MDLYNLGVSLWYAFTGAVPFAGRTLGEISDHPARLHLPVEQLTERNVPACVVALLRRVLAVDATERSASAKEFLEVLDACRKQIAAGKQSFSTRRRFGLTATVLALTAGAGWWAYPLYGGNGQTTFALPNLQSRVPVHFGSGAGLSPYSLGQQGGEVNHTLTTQEIGVHSHSLIGTDTATATAPSTAVQLGASTVYPQYLAAAPNTVMNTAAIASVGNGQPHGNTQPILAVNFIIALQGIFPSRN